jgi:hypothetical protein
VLSQVPAAVLVALGLAPSALGFLFAQRQDALHYLVLVLVDLLYLLIYLLIGAAAATATFRMRTRGAANGLVII